MTVPDTRGNMPKQFTAIIRRDKDGYVAHCLEIDVECRSKTWEEAKDCLRKAVEDYVRTASPEKLANISEDFFLYRFDVEI